MENLLDGGKDLLVNSLEVVAVQVQHLDQVEGGEGGAANAIQQAMRLRGKSCHKFANLCNVSYGVKMVTVW